MSETKLILTFNISCQNKQKFISFICSVVEPLTMSDEVYYEEEEGEEEYEEEEEEEYEEEEEEKTIPDE